MDQEANHKLEFKDKLISFYNKKKIKIFIFVGTLIIFFIFINLFKINNERKNSLIGEKYIKAGLYFDSKKMKISKNLYEEVILSKNKFYSILALNDVLEKNLISDENKVLKYFEIVEKSAKSNKEQKDLIIFKKALYLIKKSKVEQGNALLEKLIEEKSKLKVLSKEIIDK